jgi:hypothetical protein
MSLYFCVRHSRGCFPLQRLKSVIKYHQVTPWSTLYADTFYYQPEA